MASKMEKKRRNRKGRARMKVRDLSKENHSIGAMRDVSRAGSGGAKRSGVDDDRDERDLSRF